MAGRFRPQVHTHATSPGWLRIVDARVPEDGDGLSRLVQDESAATRKAAHMHAAVETIEARPVRVRYGCGQ